MVVVCFGLCAHIHGVAASSSMSDGTMLETTGVHFSQSDTIHFVELHVVSIFFV